MRTPQSSRPVLPERKLKSNQSYDGNPLIRRANVKLALTKEEVEEWAKCADDPIYFIENYVKFVTLDEGLTHIDLYDFQKDLINTYKDNRFVVAKLPRQTGKSTMTCGYLLWFILFHEYKTTAILAQKEKTAIEILGRVRQAFEYLPVFLQQGVKEWNKGSIELENGCRIFAESTTSGSIRGFTIDILVLDEFAHVAPHVAEEFFTAVFPTISSGKNSKIFMISTPNGLNLFYKFWQGASYRLTDASKWNRFVGFQANWWDVPGRDQAWADQQMAILGEHKYNQEVLCEFLGSSHTLINGKKLAELTFIDPIKTLLGTNLQMYQEADKDTSYVCIVDPSEGRGLDHSVFTIFNVSKSPFEVAAKFRSNQIDDVLLSNYVFQVAQHYNNAYVVVEVNNPVGALVVNNLWKELEYENIYFTRINSTDREQTVAENQMRSAKLPGVKTSKRVKTQGCSRLKTLVENNLLIVNDFDMVSELSTFVLSKSGNGFSGLYNAEPGYYDDTVTTLWLFAWLTQQPLFKEISDVNVRRRLAHEARMNEELYALPIPVVPQSRQTNLVVDPEGTIWFSTQKEFDAAYQELFSPD